MNNDEILELIESIQSMMLSVATGKEADQWGYQEARATLMEIDEIQGLLPRWVKTHLFLSSFEEYMKAKYPRDYAGRRQAIVEAFAPLVAKLNNAYAIPIDDAVSEAVELLNVEHVQSTWLRALAWVNEEPDAAITLARTLIESVCKCILELCQLDSNEFEKLSLQALFVKTWNTLNEKQQQNPLEQVQSKVNDLIAAFGALRNQLGDAHGKGSGFSPPTQLEAEFTVNLAGTITMLLIRRWQENA